MRILSHRSSALHNHAPADTTPNRVRFIVSKVDFCAGSQQTENLLQFAVAVRQDFLLRMIRLGGADKRMATEMRQLSGNVLRREYIIDSACRNRITRHAAVLGCTLFLSEGQPAFLFDCLHALAAVESVAGKDNPNGSPTLHAGKGFEKRIYGQVYSRSPVSKPQLSILQNHRGIWRDDENL